MSRSLYAAELEKAKKDLIIRRSWKTILIARSDREFPRNRFTCGFIKRGILKQDRLYGRVGSSVFKWNDLVFRNFREGNLKILDFHLYRALEGGITKRLFRFLAQLTQTRYCLVAILRLGRHPSGQSPS